MSIVEKYRLMAGEARALGARCSSDSGRRAYEQIAENYDALARLAEQRQAIFGHRPRGAFARAEHGGGLSH